MALNIWLIVVTAVIFFTAAAWFEVIRALLNDQVVVHPEARQRVLFALVCTLMSVFALLVFRLFNLDTPDTGSEYFKERPEYKPLFKSAPAYEPILREVSDEVLVGGLTTTKRM